MRRGEGIGTSREEGEGRGREWSDNGEDGEGV